MPKKPRLMLIVGKRGSGKTQLVKKLLAEIDRQRVIIFDPLGEYESGLIYYDFITFCDKIEGAESFRYILRFDNQEEYEYALEVAYAVGDLLLVIEEITHFANERSIDKSLDSIIRFGRHQNVSLLSVTQRCANIPRLLTSQMDIIISFKQTEPRDIEYLYKTVGSEAFELSELGEYKYKAFKL